MVDFLHNVLWLLVNSFIKLHELWLQFWMEDPTTTLDMSCCIIVMTFQVSVLTLANEGCYEFMSMWLQRSSYSEPKLNKSWKILSSSTFFNNTATSVVWNDILQVHSTYLSCFQVVGEWLPILLQVCNVSLQLKHSSSIVLISIHLFDYSLE